MESIKFGISYFGNRDPEHVQRDLVRIAKARFSYVVHTFSEEDLAFHKKVMQEIIQKTHKLGLEVWLDPWGVGGVFGGEAFSQILVKQPRIQKAPTRSFLRFMDRWIATAKGLGADVIFLDEPHFREVPPQGFIGWASKRIQKKGMKCAVCLYPRERIGWEEVVKIKSIDILGTDPYWRSFKRLLKPFVRYWASRIAQLAHENKKEGQIWIQSFKIPKGREDEVSNAIQIATAAGIKNIAIWSYDCGRLVDHLRSGNPEGIWRRIREVIA